jgi:hypothetical protein
MLTIASVVTVVKGLLILGQLISIIKAVVIAVTGLNYAFAIMKVKAAIAWIAAMGPIAWIIAGLAVLGAAITYYLINNWDKVKVMFTNFMNWVKFVLWPTIIDVFKMAAQILLALLFPIPYLIIKFWDQIVAGFENGINWIKSMFSSFVSWVSSIGENIINGIISGMKNAASNLYNSIKEIAKNSLNIFKEVFDINSPSKEMQKIGRYNMQGLQKGQESQVQSLASSNNKIAGATLGSFASATTNNTSASVVININGGNTSEVRSKIMEVFQDLNFQIKGA